MCTLHANSPGEAFDRILILGLRGGLALAERAIHILVGMAVDLIVHVRKRYDGKRTVRYVSEILEVMPPGDTDRPAVNRLFLPEGPGGRAVAAHTPSPRMLARLEAAGFQPGAARPAARHAPGRRAGDDHACRLRRGPRRGRDRAARQRAHQARAGAGNAAGPRTLRGACREPRRRRWLLAVAACLADAGDHPLAGGRLSPRRPAVIFLPKLTSSRAASGSGPRRSKALEQWTRRLADMLTASRGAGGRARGQRAHGPRRDRRAGRRRWPGGCPPGPAPRRRCGRSPPRSTTRRATGSPPR